MRDTIRLVWHAAPRQMSAVIGGQLAQALALVGLLVAGRALVELFAQGAATNHTVSSVAPTVGLFGAALVAQAAASTHVGEARLLLAEQTAKQLQERLVRIATTVPYAELEVPAFHDRVSRTNDQLTPSVYNLLYAVLAMSEAAISLTAVAVVLLRTVPQLLAGLALIGLPLVVVASLGARLTYGIRYELTTDDRRRSYLYRVMTDLAAAKEIRLFALAAPLTERWSALFEQRIVRLEELRRRRLALTVAGNTAAATAMVTVLTLLATHADWSTITPGDTAIAAVAFQQTLARMRAVSDGVEVIRQTAFLITDLDALEALLDRCPTPDPRPLPPLRSLELRRVSFSYGVGERPALDEIDLELRPGRLIALVGENGSGKSTLAKLISGLYLPSTGSIAWNGLELGPGDCPRVAAQVSALHQDFVRYELSATDNIGTGRLGTDAPADAVVERIQRAARQSGADRFLNSLPEGLSTTLSRSYVGGVDLSGGQWQRVGLARAFFPEAPVLLLDEPTSALDAGAELELLELLRAAFADRAIVLISHRFSTVRLADEICVLHEGAIIERGDHATLTAEGGRYASLFRSQARAFGTAPS